MPHNTTTNRDLKDTLLYFVIVHNSAPKSPSQPTLIISDLYCPKCTAKNKQKKDQNKTKTAVCFTNCIAQQLVFKKFIYICSNTEIFSHTSQFELSITQFHCLSYSAQGCTQLQEHQILDTLSFILKSSVSWIRMNTSCGVDEFWYLRLLHNVGLPSK